MSDRKIFPCLRGELGDWIYYSTLMTAEQINSCIESSKEIREAKSLEDFLQRRLHERVRKIEAYLETATSRFFNSMIVGVFDGVPDWYQFDLGSIKARNLRVSEAQLDSLHESIGLLQLSGKERMFAIDGQHRAKAIAAVWEASNSPGKERLLSSDQFSVILVAHIDDELGKKRTRRLFSDINKRAVQVSAGDLAIIDEEEIAAIVARRLYAEYRHFAKGKRISLTEKAQLDPSDKKHFTNLLTIVRVVKTLKRLYKKVSGTEACEEPNVVLLRSVAIRFFDFAIENVNVLNYFFVKKRGAQSSLVEMREEKRSMLFRPVGLTILAQIYRHFALSRNLDFLAKHINKIDFALDGRHFNGLMWTGKRMETKNDATARDLCLYLLGQMDGPQQALLKAKYELATKGSRPFPAPLVTV